MRACVGRMKEWHSCSPTLKKCYLWDKFANDDAKHHRTLKLKDEIYVLECISPMFQPC